MKAALVSLITLLAMAGVPTAPAQDPTKPAAPAKPTDAPALATQDKPKPSQEELEAIFKTTLTKATLAGRWCLIKDGKLSPEKEDKYTILGVTKVEGDNWLINTRIQYGAIDVVAPIPVQVKWAGDTAVITVDKVSIPGGGTYSSRVLIYNNTYAGTWSGGDHVGLLSGAIIHKKN